MQNYSLGRSNRNPGEQIEASLHISWYLLKMVSSNKIVLEQEAITLVKTQDLQDESIDKARVNHKESRN